MNVSLVQTLMRDENDLECSLARIKKDDYVVLIVLKDNECAIYDFLDLINHEDGSRYLLLKHYENPTFAYKDFLKLIGKMCKKSKSAKYFMNHIDEDNRMVFEDFENEHMITKMEKEKYKDRYNKFVDFVGRNAKLIEINLES
jgi:hypothetical protein